MKEPRKYRKTEEEYYHLSFRTKQTDKKSSANEQAEKMSKFVGELRRKLHEGLDAAEEIAALQSIKDEYAAYYAEQMDKLSEIYFTTNAGMQQMSRQEQYILKSAQDVEKFLQKAAGGKVTPADIAVENGRIKGLPENLDVLLNNPGQNRTYADFREEILAIKNYEQMYGNFLVS